MAPWLIWTIAFIITQIAFLQLFKYVARDTKSIGALTVAVQITAALSILLLAPFFEWKLPAADEWYVWVLFGLSLALFAIDDRMDATTRKNLDISTDTMIQQIYRLFFFALGIIFLAGRTFTWIKLLGGVLIVFANMFAIFEKGKFKLNKYVWIKLLSTVLLAVALTLQAGTSDKFNLPFFCFLSFSVPAVILLCARQATPKTIAAEIKRKEWWLITLCGVCQGLQALTLLRSFELDFFYSATISAVYVIINVFFSYIFLHERSGLIRKLIAAAVIVLSIVLITLPQSFWDGLFASFSQLYTPR